jgi:hypothetical protein
MVMLVTLTLTGFAQEHQGFQASVSTVTRFGPTLIGKSTSSGRAYPLAISVADQLNGPGLNINVGYLLKRQKIMLSAGNTLRYDIVGYMKVYMEPKSDAKEYWVALWHLIDDLDFNLTKYFPVGRTEPYVTIGACLMNRNSAYQVPDTSAAANPSGVEEQSYISGNFCFPALKTGIGIRYQQWIAEINLLWEYQEVYSFNENLLMPEIRLGYAITR